MKIELATIIASKQEIPWLDFGLESILEKTKHDITSTLYLARYTDEMFESCGNLADKYNINLEPRGDNSPLQYINETKHKGFDIHNVDCVMSLQPDVVFTQKNSFDDCLHVAADHLDSKYYICISSQSPDDIQPMGVMLHTKLGWEKLGCEDINFYPLCGGEHDWHRRCYLEWGLDPNNLKLYMHSIDGKPESTPPWVCRISCDPLLHLEKDWNVDERLRGRTGNKHKLLDYGIEIFGKSILHEWYIPYYSKKWGGVSPFERYLYPFDNEKYSRKIEWEDSIHPYKESLPPSLRGLII